MSKSIINLVEVRSDNSVIVYYESGITRPYRNMDVLPKTAKAWLDSHTAPESVKVMATAEGVQIQTETVTPETMTEAPETSIEAVETTEPVECNFIMVNAPTEATEAVEPSRSVICPPCAVEIKTEPITATGTDAPEPIRMEPVTVAKLAALGAACTGLRCLAVGCHALAITAEIAEATREITAEIRTDTAHAIHKMAARIRGKAEATGRAVRRAQKGIRKAWGIISTAAMETVRKTAIQAREAWLWRAELITAETVMG